VSTVTPDLCQLKSTLKSVWMAGDFGQIASFNVNAGQQFVANTQIKPATAFLTSQGLWEEHNTATDGTVNVTAEYLDVRAIRA
jgi:hypothetical protein